MFTALCRPSRRSTKRKLFLESRVICLYTVFRLKTDTAFITKSDFWLRRLIECDVYQMAAFIINGRLKVRRSIEGGINQRAAFIRGNTVIHINKYLASNVCLKLAFDGLLLSSARLI